MPFGFVGHVFDRLGPRLVVKSSGSRHSIFTAVCYLWSPYVIGQTIYIFILLFVLLSFFFFLAYSQRSEIECLPYFHTWCGLSVNLGCRSETCCTWLAGNAGCKKTPKVAICAPLYNFVGLYLRN